MRRRVVLVVVALALTGALLAVLAGDLRRLAGVLAHFGWWWTPLILICTTGNYLLRFGKWEWYRVRVGGGAMGRRESAAVFTATLALTLAPAKAGEAFKAYLLRRRTGVPLAVGLAVVFAERLTDGLAIVVLATFGLGVAAHGWPLLLATAVGALGAVAVTQHRPTTDRLVLLATRLPLVGPKLGGLAAFVEHARALFRPAPLAGAVGVGVVSWLLECVAFFLVLLGLGQTASWSLFAVAVSVFSVTTLLGGASLLPGGLGVAEAGIAGLLLAALPGAIGREEAVAAALLIRFATLWYGIALGVVALATHRHLLTDARAVGGGSAIGGGEGEGERGEGKGTGDSDGDGAGAGESTGIAVPAPPSTAGRATP